MLLYRFSEKRNLFTRIYNTCCIVEAINNMHFAEFLEFTYLEIYGFTDNLKIPGGDISNSVVVVLSQTCMEIDKNVRQRFIIFYS